MNIQTPICVDDFGVEVFVCHATKRLLWATEAIPIGTYMPGVKARYFISDNAEARAAHKQSIRWFHEHEANCNTCAYLERLPHAKTPGRSLFPGKCLSQAPDRAQHPYGMAADGSMRFAPDDWQGMKCHQPRWATP